MIEKKTSPVRTISLLIRKADEEAWTYAEKLGEISLSLGSPGDYENPEDVTEASKAGQEFLQWMADLREQAEKARAEALDAGEPDVVETTQLAPAPKKKVFQMMKMHQGKMTLFEFEEGNPVPRIVLITGSESDETERSWRHQHTEADKKDDLDHLLGEDSPFFQPRKGGDGSARATITNEPQRTQLTFSAAAGR